MEKTLEIRCKDKERELLDKYFGNLAEEAAIERSETIGEYTRDLPLKIEAEYRSYLESLWSDSASADPATPLVLEERRLRELMTDDDREGIDAAYRSAAERTLWERITKSNHKDVTYYKGLLKAYTEELLLVMRTDFLEEITGRHLRCKAFEEK